MRISSLKYFYEVAELKSISKVSNDLHISQPALSHQLSKLEKELGAKLFERSNRGVELTPKGKVLYNYAKDILALHNNLIYEINEDNCSKDEITINILSVYAGFLIDNIAMDLGNIFKNTNINININKQLDNNDKALLLHNRADVVVGCKKIDDVDLVSHYIGSDKLILVSGTHIECNKAEELSIALLDNRLGVSSSNCDKLGKLNICLRTDSIDVIKAYLKNQNVAAIVPSSAIKEELKSGSLMRICGCGYEIDYDLFITHKKDIDMKFKRRMKVFKEALENILIDKTVSEIV